MKNDLGGLGDIFKPVVGIAAIALMFLILGRWVNISIHKPALARKIMGRPKKRKWKWE